MDPMTRAEAYANLRSRIQTEQGECTNKSLAQHLGVSQQRVSEVLKLLEAPEDVRDRLRQLDLGHRATVDAVRKVIASNDPAGVLSELQSQRGGSAETRAKHYKSKPGGAGSRRKTARFVLDEVEVVIKAPSDKSMTKADMIAELQKLIAELNRDGET
jgi:hypothetical protein